MSVLSQQTYQTGCVFGGKLLKEVTILLSPNLEVKRAIDTILFCPKDRSQMFCHACALREPKLPGLTPDLRIARHSLESIWCSRNESLKTTTLFRNAAQQICRERN